MNLLPVLAIQLSKSRKCLGIDENGVYDFLKKSSVIYYTKDALEEINNDIQDFANAEGLTAHANSIKVRFDD